MIVDPDFLTRDFVEPHVFKLNNLFFHSRGLSITKEYTKILSLRNHHI